MQPQPSVADGIRTVIKVEVRGNKAGQTGFPHVDVQVLRFRRAEEGSCDRQVCDLFSQKSGTISSLHHDVENLAVTEVIHTGSFCLGDEAMQLDEEEDVE